ncbi:ectoine hydroxylase [Marinomonas ostreistagni]|uniref:Ectoine hydroxylase n=1 Tax=Marinomonas ostreistagni TaxID=359209 RepID=A0ABS0ZAW4_9GAMM|nr:ectoine hydroxylase [Marinomonas ostreistagni]MBJ7550799.1 ectoine hydroxylase [Marinomonas ostreistagni]
MAELQTLKYGTEDCYPSRIYSKPVRIPRQDPVVYSKASDNAPLTAAQIAEYERKGFLFLDDLFTQQELALMIEEMQRMREDPSIKNREESITEQNSGAVRSVFSLHTLSDVFAKLAEDPRLVAIAEYLLGDKVYIHQSRLNYKPGFSGKEFFWHSDFETWHTEDGMPRMRALSMSIALTKNEAQNGPLMLIPGSHKSFISCVGETPKNHHLHSLKKQEFGVPDEQSLIQMVREGGIETAIGPLGRITLFDCNTMHGSNGNITPNPRSNLFFVFNAVSNQVTNPFAKVPARPEYIGTRDSIKPLKSVIFN